MRQSLWSKWVNHLHAANVQFKSDLARIEVSRLVTVNVFSLKVVYELVCEIVRSFMCFASFQKSRDLYPTKNVFGPEKRDSAVISIYFHHYLSHADRYSL